MVVFSSIPSWTRSEMGASPIRLVSRAAVSAAMVQAPIEGLEGGFGALLLQDRHLDARGLSLGHRLEADAGHLGDLLFFGGERGSVALVLLAVLLLAHAADHRRGRGDVALEELEAVALHAQLRELILLSGGDLPGLHRLGDHPLNAARPLLLLERGELLRNLGVALLIRLPGLDNAGRLGER